MVHSLLMLAGILPMMAFLAFVFLDRWERKRAGKRTPLENKPLLRAAGHGLSLRLADLHELLMIWLGAAGVMSLGAAGVLGADPSAASHLSSRLIFAGAVVFCTGMALDTWRKIREVRLGWFGEQAVAEELQPLWAEGCKIFHDVPGDGKWNVDHVVVGPTGVFAIETKMVTKQPGSRGGKDHEAVFDGKAIHYPHFRDTNAMEQALRNARWLAEFLSKSTGRKVAVTPIVALPGWFVTLKANAEVKVLNPKQIIGFITREPAMLSREQIQQIAFQIEQRCRDVEF